MDDNTVNNTTIQISCTTREKLKDIMTKRHTYDSMIVELINKYKKDVK